MFLGVKVVKGAAATKLDLGGLVLLALSMVFIAIGLIILPVALDGIAGVIHGGGSGVSSSYSGLQPILLVTPLLILIAFLTGTVISGYLGVKSLGSQ